MAKPKGGDKVKRQRKDGRKSFLAYLQPDVIRSLKVSALDQGIPAYRIVEDALKDWLKGQPKAD
ncbi:hypothetical protein [Devosia sp. A369]